MNPPQIFLSHQIPPLLPMDQCIDGMTTALKNVNNCLMPIRTVVRLPCSEGEKEGEEERGGRLGMLGMMPTHFGGMVSCKVVTVFPGNSPEKNGFSAHQGQVLLFEGDQNGQLLSMSDAHTITGIRTAAATAAATREIYLKTFDFGENEKKGEGEEKEFVLALLGTGEQCYQHARSLWVVVGERMRELGYEVVVGDKEGKEGGGKRVRVVLNIWGRRREKAEKVKKEILKLGEQGEGYHPLFPRFAEINIFSSSPPLLPPPSPPPSPSPSNGVPEAIAKANIICTLTSAITPFLAGSWIPEGCHVNAIGSCAPIFREFNSVVLRDAGVVWTDTRGGCLKEAGEVVGAVEGGEVVVEEEGKWREGGALGEGVVRVMEVGDVEEWREGGGGGKKRISLFKSLGCGLEDLIAARIVYENSKKMDNR